MKQPEEFFDILAECDNESSRKMVEAADMDAEDLLKLVYYHLDLFGDSYYREVTAPIETKVRKYLGL